MSSKSTSSSMSRILAVVTLGENPADRWPDSQETKVSSRHQTAAGFLEVAAMEADRPPFQHTFRSHHGREAGGLISQLLELAIRQQIPFALRIAMP